MYIQASNLQNSVLPTVTTFFSDAAIQIGFSESDYLQIEEPNAMLRVSVSKGDVFLANPVTIRVTSLTVEEALSMGVINASDRMYMLRDGDAFSPSRASTKSTIHRVNNYLFFVHV